MSQFSLLQPKAPPDQLARGVDLRCCSCDDPLFVADAAGAALVIADPPWFYPAGFHSATEATDHYDTLPTEEIVRHLDLFRAGRMALWTTWPRIQEWYTATRDWRWGGSVSGGAWTKSGDEDSGHYGPGHHWAGCSEPVLVYTGKNAQTYREYALRNAWPEPPGLHSRKPVGWMRQWLRRWTMPGDLVVDPYAGLASVAEACLLEGRRYLGAEISPDRHAQALALLAQVRT